MTKKTAPPKKQSKPKANDRAWVRLSTFEKNRLQGLADRWAGGNLSAYLVYAGLNVSRRKLRPDDFQHSQRYFEQ